jgi:ribose transport system permease protein
MKANVKLLGKASSLKDYSSVVILIIMVVITATLQNNFFTVSGFVNLCNSFIPLVLLTIGQAVVLISGAVDLSNGMALSLMTCVLAATMKTDRPITSVTAIVLVVITASATALLNGFAIGIMKIPPVIATFAASFIFMGAGLYIMPQPGGQSVAWLEGFYNFSLVPGAPGWLIKIGNVLPPSLWLFLIVIGLWAVIRRTKFCRYLYATGSNEENAYCSGVNTSGIRIAACFINAFCIMLAALFFVAQNQSGDYMLGNAFTLNTIAAAVIGGVAMTGGKGGVFSAVTGALILGFVNQIIFYLNLPTSFSILVSGIIVIVAISVPQIYEHLNENAKL